MSSPLCCGRGLRKPSFPAVGKDEREKNGNLQYSHHWVHFTAPKAYPFAPKRHKAEAR